MGRPGRDAGLASIITAARKERLLDAGFGSLGKSQSASHQGNQRNTNVNPSFKIFD
jgi:hypothetical protein